MRKKIPDCIAPGWTETKKKTVLVALGWKRPRKDALSVGLA
jgi:hypothetical protein